MIIFAPSLKNKERVHEKTSRSRQELIQLKSPIFLELVTNVRFGGRMVMEK